MKAVLLPIWPQYCELITNGKKTVEVRKSFPNIPTPFRCYIYETKGKTDIPTFVDEDGHYIYEGRGQVIGEFEVKDYTCFIPVTSAKSGCLDYLFASEEILRECCLTKDELLKYGKGKQLYGWHISDLVIYDKPKELSEFHRPCTPACNYSEECGGANATDCLFGINRAPQSWCYVEVVA